MQASQEAPSGAELTLGICLAALVAVAVNGASAVPLCYFAVLTPALWRVDVVEHRLPNGIVLPGVLLAAATAIAAACTALVVSPDPKSVISSLTEGIGGGMLVTVAPLALLSLSGGIGMGDVKLILGLVMSSASDLCGFIDGVEFGFRVLLGACVLALLASLPKIARRRFRERIAFGPAILAATWTDVIVLRWSA